MLLNEFLKAHRKVKANIGSHGHAATETRWRFWLRALEEQDSQIQRVSIGSK